MSLKEMREVSSAAKEDQCPSEALREDGCEGLVAYDDLSGQEFDPKFMMRARRE